jgi:hypothetical protein
MGGILFVRDLDDGTRRQAHVQPADVQLVIDELERAPGGLGDSPAAAEALGTLGTAVEQGGVGSEWQLSDDESDAVHWALERMMAERRVLAHDLHELRDVVAPITS